MYAVNKLWILWDELLLEWSIDVNVGLLIINE